MSEDKPEKREREYQQVEAIDPRVYACPARNFPAPPQPQPKKKKRRRRK
jgi:hypothetical protein